MTDKKSVDKKNRTSIPVRERTLLRLGALKGNMKFAGFDIKAYDDQLNIMMDQMESLLKKGEIKP